MKKTAFILVALFLILALTLCGCKEEPKRGVGVDVDIDLSEDEAAIEYEGEYTKELAGTTINVFNWGEYIPDGTEGSLDINKEFTKLTGIKVNYTTYESNEAMYSKLKGGGVSYDIIIPSDYMIDRMKK